MKITNKTLTETVLPILSKDNIDELLEKVEEYPLEKSIFNMTCGEFIESLNDDFILKILNEKYLIIALGKLKTYKREMGQLDKFLKMNEIKLSSEEKQAQLNVIFPTFQERILLTVAEYFHLKNFNEAEDIPLSNYLLITKSKSADAKFENNYRRIIENKSKMKRR